MSEYTTQTAGVGAVLDQRKSLKAIIYRDPISGKNVFYSVKECGLDDILELVGQREFHGVEKPIKK